MSRQIYYYRRPDFDHDIQHVVDWKHHRCEMSRKMIQKLGHEQADDADLLLFPVGYIGSGFPAWVPFEVTSTEECEACGKWVKMWCAWNNGKIVDLKTAGKGSSKLSAKS